MVADGKRGDVPVTAARLRAGAGRRDADPLGAGRRARRRRLHRQPAARRATRSSRWSRRPPRPAPGSSPWSAPAIPGAADLQDLPAPRAPLHERLAALVDGLADRGSPGAGGLSGMGAVVGATEPEHIARLRELMPRSIFLIPGVGAQGGRPELLGAAFAAGPRRGAGRRLAQHRRRPRSRPPRPSACAPRFGTVSAAWMRCRGRLYDQPAPIADAPKR